MTNITRLKLCLCLVALAVMPVAATGYELHYDADGPALNDVCALDVDSHAVFWTVGDSGRVFKAVDGQLTDSFTLGGGDYDLHGVSFFPAGQTGYIVGYKRDDLTGIVFRTLNGGTNWESKCPDFPDVGTKLPFLKVQCVPSHYVWVACGDGYVVWSDDWRFWNTTAKPGGDDDYSYLWGLWCIDSLHAWVASDQSRMIAKTENVGCTWDTFFPLLDDSLSYRGLGSFDPTTGPDFDSMSVAASRGEIVSTTNGGSDWSKDSYNPCQWWRGTSQNYTDCGSRLCVGTCGTPGRTTRYDLNDVEQIEVGYNHWDVSVGTNAAIVVDSFSTSPGILEECTLDWLDAVSTNGDSVLIYFTFTNTTDHDSLVDVYLWRSIMQEDFGGEEDAYFYWLDDSFPDRYVHKDDADTWCVTNYVPTNQTFWFALTTTSEVPNCSASPNVDSARGFGAPQTDPLYPSDWIYASDAPDDHGSSLYYHWDTIPHDDSTRMNYAIIRPPTDTTHPYYTGHRGGLIATVEFGVSPSHSSYTEGSLVTGEQYHRGVRPYTDRLNGRTSQYFPQDSATPVDNVKPPTVTGLSVRYVPEIDACEVWWDPIPESGDPEYPETFEPNLGGYWVCPYVAGSALDDIHDTHLNHQSPLFRTHYVEAADGERVQGDTYVFCVTARDRTGNKGDWCAEESVYIPCLASTSPLATAYNSGTHLARAPGTADEHIVYESNGEVHYAYSTDGGYEWQNRTTIDTGASPAVATNGSGHPWIVYVQGNTVRYRLRYTNSASGVLFDSQDDSIIPGPPAIALTQSETNQYAFAAFPVYDLDAGTSSIRVVKFDEDTSVSVVVDTILNEAMSDSFVSLSLSWGDVVRCCWQRDSAIVYSEAMIPPMQWELLGWSSPHALSDPGTLAKHPFCAVSDDSVFAVWSDYDGGEIMRVAHDVWALPDSWGTPQGVSPAGEFSDYPQMSTPRVMSWQSLPMGGNWEFSVMIDDSIVNLIPPLGHDQCYGHISAQLPDPPDSNPPVVYAAWTEGPMEGGYYEIKSCVYGLGAQDCGMAAGSVPVARTELSSVAPNPFSRTTAIRYQLARQGRAKLTVFDACGRGVRTLVSSEQKPGKYAVSWDGTDNRQRLVPRGVYFVRFEAPDCTGRKKLTLTR